MLNPNLRPLKKYLLHRLAQIRRYKISTDVDENLRSSVAFPAKRDPAITLINGRDNLCPSVHYKAFSTVSISCFVLRIYAFIAFTVIFLSGCQNQRLYKDAQVMMGTFVEVTSPDRHASGIVFAEIKRIEGLLSKYQENSQVSRLNQLGKLQVSPETFYIIDKAKEFYEASDGAFDITVGPLVELWGFSDKNFSVPQEQKIKNILWYVGSDKIILHHRNNVVELKTLGVKIDLGAIAKGYALDCAVDKLKKRGIKDCLINAGGQVYALGEKFGLPWKIAISSPRGQGTGEILALRDSCVSTSGDYEQYFIQGGRRYSHILNPKTGYPADSGIVSVTVIAPSGLTADALSTAIFVLGKEKGEALAKKFAAVEVRIIEK